MSERVLETRALVKRFEEGPQVLEILHGIDMQVSRGEFVAIVGSSGSGKTTLLHLLGGLDTPTSGEVRICGEDFSQCNEVKRGWLRNRHIGFVYQFHHLLPEFTALENVCMPLLLRDGSIAEAEKAATLLLQRVGLGERLQHKPSELSGGSVSGWRWRVHWLRGRPWCWPTSLRAILIMRRHRTYRHCCRN
jgi:lipoprotein-releasing system ATP-binding protein